jgi:hypothetical protein
MPGSKSEDFLSKLSSHTSGLLDNDSLDQELLGLDEIQSDASCWDPYTIYDPNALDTPLEAPSEYPSPPDSDQWNSFNRDHR